MSLKTLASWSAHARSTRPGKSDHNSILIHAYKQKLKQEAPVTRSVRKWSDEADAKLQNCFASTDCNMFWESYDGIEEYTTVTGFINKCLDDVVPTVTVCTYPNQKPWTTGNIRTKLKSRAAAFKERNSNPEAYKILVRNQCFNTLKKSFFTSSIVVMGL
jgi:hypothetical protein